LLEQIGLAGGVLAVALQTFADALIVPVVEDEPFAGASEAIEAAGGEGVVGR